MNFVVFYDTVYICLNSIPSFSRRFVFKNGHKKRYKTLPIVAIFKDFPSRMRCSLVFVQWKLQHELKETRRRVSRY